MQKIFTKILFFSIFVFSCNFENIRQENNTEGKTIYDNEALIYNNYRQKEIEGNVMEVDAAIINSKKPCIVSCVQKTTKIAIITGKFNSSIEKEVQNTLTLAKKLITNNKHEIKLINNQDSESQINLFEPDYIISSVNSADIIPIQNIAGQINAPILSLVPLHSNNARTYNFAYSIQNDISSVMFVFEKQGYKNIALFALNDDIGANVYKAITKEVDKKNQKLTNVEFFTKPNIEKHIARIKSSTKQSYYQNIKNHDIVENTHNFAKQIKKEDKVEENGITKEIVTLTNGKKYEKKYRALDMLIIDADADSLPIILSSLDLDPDFKNVAIIASPRSTENIIKSYIKNGSEYKSLQHSVIFTSQFSSYLPYATEYFKTFGEFPSKFSTTLYETMQYLLELDSIKGEKFDFTRLSKFNGINGTITFDTNKTTKRFVNISKLENGVIKEIVNTYDLYNAK